MKVTVEGNGSLLAFEIKVDGLSENDLLYACCSLLRSTVVWLTGEGDLPDPDAPNAPARQSDG